MKATLRFECKGCREAPCFVCRRSAALSAREFMSCGRCGLPVFHDMGEIRTTRGGAQLCGHSGQRHRLGHYLTVANMTLSSGRRAVILQAADGSHAKLSLTLDGQPDGTFRYPSAAEAYAAIKGYA